MDIDYVIRLTISAYQLTEEWGEKSLLRLKTRKSAAGVLKNFILASCSNPVQEAKKELYENLSRLEETLRWARREKLINRKNFIFLKEEYGRLREVAGTTSQVEQAKEQPQPEPVKEENKKPKAKELEPKKKPRPKLKAREAKIVEVLKEQKRAQVNELKEFFPDISKRTLRRDIDSLLQKKLIVRHGEWNDVYYTLN